MSKPEPLPANQRSIDAAKVVPGKRTRYRIAGVQGLVLEVTDTNRSWHVHCNTGDGRKAWRTIGNAKAITVGRAIDEAKKFVESAQLGDFDNTAVETYGAVLDRWLVFAERRIKPNTLAEYKRLIETKIRGRLGALPIRSIDRQRIIAMLDEIAIESTPTQANRVQGVVSASFSWALDEGCIEHNPASRIRKRGAERKRSRVYSDAELRAIWHGTETLSPGVRDAIRLLMLLGQRLAEIAHAERKEVDPRAPDLSIRHERRKGWRIGKRELPHVVPLPPIAWGIMAAAALSARDAEHVFPNRTIAKAGPMSKDSVSSGFARLLRSLKIKEARLHDLRHTVKTNLAALGVPQHVADRVQDHTDAARGAAAGYDHFGYEDEKRRALLLWESRLLEIVEGRPSSGLRW